MLSKPVRCIIPFLLFCVIFGHSYAASQAPDVDIETVAPPLPEPEPDSIRKAKKGFFGSIVSYFERANIDRTFEKKIDFGFLPGPHYSSDIGFGLGMVASGLYRTDRTDSISPPSNVSLVGDIATTGFWVVGLRGNTFFKGAKYRLDYKLMFNTTPKAKYWGVGYDMGSEDANETTFRRSQVYMDINFMYRLIPNLYAGATLKFDHYTAKKFGNENILAGQKNRYVNTGIGLFMLYDSRDNVTDPYSGFFVKLENIIFPDFFGNDPGFNRTNITFDFYHRLWPSAMMAYDLYGEYNQKNVPWTMMAQLGGSHRMRGYYEGRYRDRGMIEMQAEIRQKIWRRIGATAWVGAGNVFSSFGRFDLSHTLPNYGVGLRWEFKKRVNVRFDYGMGKGERGFIFNINEAF